MIEWLITIFLLSQTEAFPQGTLSPIVTAAPPTGSTRLEQIAADIQKPPPGDLTVTKFHVRSEIQFRYARTVVELHTANRFPVASSAAFSIVLPKSAFISNFSMTIKDKEYVARVEKKDDAQKEFDNAVAAGQGAGIIKQDARDANRFTVAANVEGGDKVVFRIVYEEHLERKLGKYQHKIHVNPGQVVNDFRIEVLINETRPVIDVHVPEIQTDPNAIVSDDINPNAKITTSVDGSPNVAQVLYKPDTVAQKSGIQGQFIVEYDVERSQNGNEVQLVDGYFVHLVAPDQLQVLPKHVILIMDVSGSMSDEKLQQTKDAMVTIIDQLGDQDFLNLISFNDNLHHFVPPSQSGTDPQRTAYRALNDVKTEALRQVLDWTANGGTNLNEAIVEGVAIANRIRSGLEEEVKPIIIFMTDGQPTVGETNPTQIKSNVQNRNVAAEKVPIYTLAFGAGADFNLLRDISVRNSGFARRIYEGADAVIQLEDFYAEIASPLLSNLKFKYVGDAIANGSVTNPKVKTFFRGGEMVSVGRYDKPGVIHIDLEGDTIGGKFESKHCLRVVRRPSVDSLPFDGCVEVPETPKSEAQSFLERLWAYLTIREYLDDPNATAFRKDRAFKLALKYNFVTPLTSLIVVKPDEDPVIIDPVPVSSDRGRPQFGGGSSFFASGGGTRLAFSPPRSRPAPPRRKTVAAAIVPDYDFFDSSLPPRRIVSTTRRPVTTRRTTTTTVDPRPCELRLYDKTLLRGENITITGDVENDFAQLDFDNKLTSLEVVGSCCWVLYTEKNLQGVEKRFASGKHQSATEMGDLFRDASSAKKLPRC